MLNFHDFVRGLPRVRKIVADELLFAEYHCLVEATRAGIWSHQNYIAFVISGKKMWQSMHHDHVVEEGQAIFVRKGANMVHQFFDDDFCCLLIFLPDDFIRSFMGRHPSLAQVPTTQVAPSDPVIQMSVDDLMRSYFASVLSYFPLVVPPAPELMKLKFEELLHHIFSRDQLAGLAAYLRSLSRGQRELLRRIMEDNFAYNLELEEFAAMCGMSLSSFKRNFKEVFQEAPGKWLLGKRLEFGSHLLRSTDKDVNQVAFDCGFENTSHFIRVFKEKYGSTPSQFRAGPVRA